MNYKEKAEKYVREKLPELMELSFGCEVHWQKPKEGFKRFFLDYSEKEQFAEKYAIIVSHDHRYSSKFIVKTEELIVIGHPIQLVHVLRLVHEDLQSEALSNWDLYQPWENQHEGLYQWLCEHWHI